MNKALRTAALAAASLATLCFSGAASAAWTFADDTGGASISGAYPSFTLTGSDLFDFKDDVATYTQAFTSAQAVTFAWNYVSEDCCGSAWDPAGYVLNGVQHQLSVNGPAGQGSAGVATVDVGAGDVFGWYVESLDSEQGPGILSVSVVPEPATVALLLAGVGALVFAARRRAKG
jgi:hypothetical protein